MRFFFGIIVGICLTVGAAYITDTMRDAHPPGSGEPVAMVNWSVVDANLRHISDNMQTAWINVQNGWAKLFGHSA